MEYKHRFLDEYANHKRREVKKHYPKEYQETPLSKIDKAVWMAHRGYIILDEAMRLLSEI